MDMPENIWVDRGQIFLVERGQKYTLTSSIAAKLEAAEKMAEALKAADGAYNVLLHCANNFELNYVRAQCMKKVDESLALWQRVNGEKP